MARLGYAVVAGLMAAGALTAPAAAAGGGTVQGEFVTSDDQPIGYAYVTAYSGDDEWLDSTNTDSSGHFSFTDLPVGGIKLQFDNNGLQQWSPGVIEGADAKVYQLAAGAGLTVTEHQRPTGRLTGHFTGADGSQAWASVVAQGVDNGLYLNGYTGENSEWVIEAFPGTYTVNFTWDGSKQWAVQSPTADGATVYTVVAGQTTTIDDHKLPTGSITGHLTKADGSPLTEAYVTLHQGDESIGWSSTDLDGNYSLGEVLAGDGYTVSFNVNNGTDQWISGTLDHNKARKISVIAGQTTTADDAQLAPSTMHGRLSDSTGGPVANYGVTVQLDDPDNWVSYSAETDANGEWSVSDVFPGDYKVSFNTPDFHRTQWAYGKSAEADASLITVEAGGNVTVDETWLPGATLVVDAVDAATGAPVRDYCVWVTSPGDGSGCTNGTSVTVQDLPGGTYQLFANPGEDSYYLSADRQEVTLTPGQTTRATVRLALGGKVSFTATDRVTGSKLQQVCANLMVLGHGGLPDSPGDCTDGTGAGVTRSVAAGAYEMFAVAPRGYGHQWVGANGGTGDQQAAARVNVVPGTTVAAPPVLLDKAGTITGVVTDKAGAPLADVDVAYSAWGDAGPAWDTQTDDKGKYTIGVLGPYRWPLLFGGTFPREWSGHTANRFAAKTVKVVAGGTTTFNFTPQAKVATLKGRVTAPSTQWRFHTFNAVTGDVMGSFDAYGAGAGGAYELKLTGDQKVKIDWIYFPADGSADVRGWYDHATGIDTATKVAIPATGTKKLNLTLG
jgi:hypothetical protein